MNVYQMIEEEDEAEILETTAILLEEEDEEDHNEEEITNQKQNKIIRKKPKELRIQALPIREEEMREIFEAKCNDFNVKFQDKHYQKFLLRQKNFNSVKTLNMNGVGVGLTASELLIKSIKMHPKIVIIDMSNNFLADEGALSFAKLILSTTTIISLDLSSNHMSDEGTSLIFKALENNKSLVYLNIGSRGSIGRNSVGTKGIKAAAEMLKHNSVLSELEMVLCEINSVNIMPLTSGLDMNKTLSYLNLNNNNIRSVGAVAIFKSITNSGIREIKLADNSIGDEIAPYITALLQKNKTLRLIDLSGNQISYVTAKAFCGKLASTYTIEDLILSRNARFGSRGAAALGPFLAQNQRIKRLVLSACKIDPSFFSDFCNNLAKNESIEVLELSHNSLGDDGVQKLAESLKDHENLKFLDLEMIDISDVGCRAILDILPTTKVSWLSFKNNLIHDGTILQEHLRDNEKLLKLNVEANDIDYKSTIEINKIIGRNTHDFKRKAASRLLGRVNTANKDAPANIEKRLIRKRADIVNERKNIARLKQEKAELEDSLVQTIENKKIRIANLEEKFQILSDELLHQTDSYRSQNEDARNNNSRIEAEISFKSNKLASEIENHRTFQKTVAVLDGKINAAKNENAEGEKALNLQLSEAKDKYRIARDSVIDAWKIAHHEVSEEKTPNEERVKTSKKSKRGKKQAKSPGDSPSSKTQAASPKGKTASKKKIASKQKTIKRKKNKEPPKTEPEQEPPTKETTESVEIDSTNVSNPAAATTTRSNTSDDSRQSINNININSSRSKASTRDSKNTVIVEKKDQTFDTQPEKYVQASDES